MTMSMAFDKTMEVVDQYDQPDYLEKYKNTFWKYSKFYKENDIEEMLSRMVNRTDVVKVLIEILDYKRESAFWAELLCKTMEAQSKKKLAFVKIIPFAERIATHVEQESLIDVFEIMCSHTTDDVATLREQALLGAVSNGQVAVVLHILTSQDAMSVVEAVDAKLSEAIEEYQQKCGQEKDGFEACNGDIYMIKEHTTDKTFTELLKEYKENGIITRTVESFFDDTKFGYYQPSEQTEVAQRQELGDYILNPLDARMEGILEDISYENQEWYRFYENDISSESLNELAFTYNWDDGFAIPYLIAKHKNCDKGTALNLFSMAGGFGCLERELDGELRPGDSEQKAFVHALLYRITHDFYADGVVKNTEHMYSVKRILDYKKMGIPDYFFKDSDL